MPRPALTTEAIAEFRSKLAVVATRLFATHGFEGVTLRAVAAELGVSPMTPYQYMSGKEELFALVRTEAFGRFADAQEAAARSTDDPRERLRALGRAYVRFAIEDPNAYRIMFELRQAERGPEALAQEAARGFRPLLTATEHAVNAGVLVGDPLTLAHLLWATTHGLVTLDLAGKLAMGRGLEELAEQVLATVEPRGERP